MARVFFFVSTMFDMFAHICLCCIVGEILIIQVSSSWSFILYLHNICIIQSTINDNRFLASLIFIKIFIKIDQ